MYGFQNNNFLRFFFPNSTGFCYEYVKLEGFSDHRVLLVSLDLLEMLDLQALL